MTRRARVFGAGPCLLLLALAWMPGVSRAQNANDGFDPSPNSFVYALAVQADGKVLVAGPFSSIAGQTRNGIARLNTDGSLDAGFAATAVDGVVVAVAVQADGRIVIGGSFAQVGVYVRHRIARLNADGSVDAAFDPNASGNVYALAQQADGKLLMGGFFGSLAPNGGAAVTRDYIARLNVDGSVDTAYDPHADSTVIALAVQPDGKLVVGGSFSSLSPNGGAAVTRNYIARLNTDGSVDAAFNPNANNSVSSLALRPDGKLLVGGDFTALAPNGGPTVTRSRIARLNADGSVDTALYADANSTVRTLALQPDGKLVLGGDFTSLAPGGVGAITRHYIARLNEDGSVDAPFNPDSIGTVRALALQPDGKLVVGGDFSSLSPNGGAFIPRFGVARLYADGAVDAAFDPNADGVVLALAVQPDGKTVVGGSFTSLSPNGGGADARDRIARLNADGSLDQAFDPNASGIVYALAVQPDGKLVVGGDFTSLSPAGGGPARQYLARLNVDGNIDAGFNPNPGGVVRALALQADGKLVVAGDFTSLAPNGGAAITRNRIARLNVDGSVDAFDPNANNVVYALALQPDGLLVVGGSFTSLSPNGGGAVARNRIARLTVDGSVDTAFNPNADNTVYALALQPDDGKVVVAGFYTSLSPNGGGAVPRNHLARLNADGSVEAAFDPSVSGSVFALALQANGKLAFGGSFTSLSPNGGGPITRNRIARLNADGSVDAAFDPNANNYVAALAVLPDGKLVAGGAFTAVGPQARNFLARLNTPQAALQSLSIVSYSAGGSSITWTRSGAAPQLALPPTLLFSVAGNTYGGVGTMQRVGNGWRYSGFAAPLNQTFYLRALGQASSGQYNGSAGLVESTRQFYLSGNDGIFANGFD